MHTLLRAQRHRWSTSITKVTAGLEASMCGWRIVARAPRVQGDGTSRERRSRASRSETIEQWPYTFSGTQQVYPGSVIYVVRTWCGKRIVLGIEVGVGCDGHKRVRSSLSGRRRSRLSRWGRP